MKTISIYICLLLSLSLFIEAKDSVDIEFEYQKKIYATYKVAQKNMFHIALITTGTKGKMILQNAVLIDKEGLLLTTDKISGTKGNIICSDSQDAIYKCKVFRKDKMAGISIIKIIDFKFDVAFHEVVKFADSQNVRVGQTALVTPFVSGASNPCINIGVIGCTDRGNLNRVGIKVGGEFQWIQTDAEVNKNDGGVPLWNIHGQMVGMCYEPSRNKMGDNLAFAIPSDYLKLMIKKLKPLENEKSELPRFQIGVRIKPYHPVEKKKSKVSEELALTDADSGFVLQSVSGNKAADYAGLKKGDLITKLNNTSVRIIHQDELFRIRAFTLKYKKGDVIEVEYYRDKKPGKTSFKLLGKSEYASDEIDETIGVYLNELTEERMKRFKIGEKAGVLIVGAKPKSMGSKSGLNKFCRIVSIDNKKIDSITSFKNTIKDLKENKKESVLMVVYYKSGKSWKKYSKSLEIQKIKKKKKK